MGLLDTLKGLFSGGAGGNGRGDGDGIAGEVIDCREALSRLFEYLDGELDDVGEEEAARHFEVCERCYPRLQFEKAFQEAVRRVRAGEEPPGSLRRRVLDTLKAQGFEES